MFPHYAQCLNMSRWLRCLQSGQQGLHLCGCGHTNWSICTTRHCHLRQTASLICMHTVTSRVLIYCVCALRVQISEYFFTHLYAQNYAYANSYLLCLQLSQYKCTSLVKTPSKYVASCDIGFSPSHNHSTYTLGGLMPVQETESTHCRKVPTWTTDKTVQQS